MNAPAARWADAIAQAARRLGDWRRYRRHRAAVLALGDRMLSDVGLTRAELRRAGYFDNFGR